MKLFETIQARQSIRAFQSTPVEPEKLAALLEAINQAPSAGNLQAYQVYVVRDRPLKRELAEAALNQTFMAEAPVVLIFCAAPRRAAKYGQRGETLYAVQDAAIAVAYAQLAATAQGLATCWIGAFAESGVSKTLQLPADQRPVAMLPIGYPAEKPPRTTRRPLSELVQEWPPAATAAQSR
jgi:nitroreductase